MGIDRLGTPELSARLDSWKEIAAYLKRDVRTVQRWEKTAGLPVHRHLHAERSGVYAFKAELDAWWQERIPQLDIRPSRLWRLAAAILIVLVGVALALVVWRARLPRQQTQPLPAGMVARRVWAGPNVNAFGSVSPDGRYLTFVNTPTGDLAVHDFTTGQNRLLSRKSSVAEMIELVQHSVISPDSTRAAYALVNQEGYYELRMCRLTNPAEDTSYTVVLRDPEIVYARPTAWSPGGQQLLTLLGRRDFTLQLALVNVNDKTIRSLKELRWGEPLTACFSPDGQYVAFDYRSTSGSRYRDIALIRVADGSEHNVIADSSNNLLLGWRGSALFFMSDRTNSIDMWQVHVSGGVPAAEPILVRKETGNIVPLGFSRSTALYYGVRISMNDVLTVELDQAAHMVPGSMHRAVRHSIGFTDSPAWSADGQRLAYVVPGVPWRDTSVVVRSERTGVERRLTPALSFLTQIMWSADETSLVGFGIDRGGRHGVYSVAVDDGKVTTLVRTTRDIYYNHPLPAPDGRTLYCKRNVFFAEPSPLVRRSGKSASETEILDSVYRAALSPDGHELAYIVYNRITRDKTLMVRPVSGGPPRILYSGRQNEVAWSADGRFVFFTRTLQRPKGTADEIWRVARHGGDAENTGVRAEAIRELRASPDGRRLAFTSGTFAYEIWVTEMPPEHQGAK